MDESKIGRIGRYDIIYSIGHGGMAEVYVGRLPGMAGFEKFVAVKLIHAHLCKEEQFIRMFLDEARLAASIRHPNVAEIYEVGREGSTYYMIGELVLGQDLHATMRQAKKQGVAFPEALTAHIISQICLGLHEAHEQKDPDGKPLCLVHRDVTPRNILLSYGGYAKLADFGVAWAEKRLSHSEAGSIRGKVAFMSPEQVRSEPVDRRSDLFALGVVLYMMLTGRHPFQGENDAATMNNIVNGRMSRPGELAPDLSPDLEAIVMTALATAPEDRYQTAAQMHEELEEWIQIHDQKVGPGQLSRLMHRLFETEIEEHELKVREYRRERGEDTDIKSVPPPPMEGDSQPRFSAAFQVDLPPGEVVPGGLPAIPPGPAGSGVFRGRRRRLVAAGGVLAGAVLVAVIVATAVGSGEPAADGPGGERTGAAAAPPPPKPGDAGGPATPEEPEEIRLDLGVLPLGAKVTLDDRDIDYPFVVPRSSGMARLGVTAPGYLPFEAKIPLDRDREVKVALEKEPMASAQPKGGQSGRSKGKKPAGDEKPASPAEGPLLPSPFD